MQDPLGCPCNLQVTHVPNLTEWIANANQQDHNGLSLSKQDCKRGKMPYRRNPLRELQRVTATTTDGGALRSPSLILNFKHGLFTTPVLVRNSRLLEDGTFVKTVEVAEEKTTFVEHSPCWARYCSMPMEQTACRRQSSEQLWPSENPTVRWRRPSAVKLKLNQLRQLFMMK